TALPVVLTEAAAVASGNSLYVLGGLTATNSPQNTVYRLSTTAATSTSWTGVVSTDWFTAGNWTNGVPTTSLDASISNGAPRYPQIAAGTASVRGLMLGTGAALTQTGGTLDVRADLTDNGTFVPTGGTVVLGNTFQSNGPNILGSSAVRFWNLTVNTNGVLLGTAAGASVQRLLTLNGAFVTQANPLTLESNSATTAMVVNNSGGFVFGTATVQRYLDPSLNAGLGYRHYSSPVQSTTVADLATSGFSPVVNPAYNTLGNTATPFPTVFGYDEARLNATSATTQSFDQGWFSPAATTDVLNPGRGYTANLAASEKVDLVGALNNGTIAVGALSRGTEANSGWQLLGNPYPAPLDWNVARAGLPTGVIDAIYVFKSAAQYTGTYQFYQNGFGTLPGGLVGSMQGFFLRVSQNVPAFSFVNAWRATAYQNPTFNRSTAETRPAVQLDLVSAAGTHEPTFVYFENGATAGFDAHFDADKLPNSTGLNLSSEIAGGQRLAVNGLPVLGTAALTVPLTVGVPAAGAYSFNVAQLLNLPATMVSLRDRQTGALIDLANQPSYSFTTAAGTLLTGRFELVFSPQRPLAVSNVALAAQVGLYPNPARLAAFVELPAALGRTAVTALLVDALGRTVRTQTLPAQGAAAHQLSLAGLANSIYTLHLHTSAGVLVKKLVVE
ncbi:MAG: T9SS type A sorting domain-containing protein, partial [Bacteroidota bacterium]|nr:T9SS type A sorting domain-containing protein [Bacteroidota bacterium]